MIALSSEEHRDPQRHISLIIVAVVLADNVAGQQNPTCATDVNQTGACNSDEPSSAHWSTLQIVLPIVAVLCTLILGGMAIFWYLRRYKRRYVQIPYHNRTASSTTDRASLALSLESSSSSARSKKNRAWEQAHPEGPKVLRIFKARATKVRSSSPSTGWSIDLTNAPAGPRTSQTSLVHTTDKSITPSSSPSGTRRVNGSQSFLPFVGSKRLPANNTSEKVLPGTPVFDDAQTPLPLIQDSLDHVDMHVRPTRGVTGTRRPMVHVVPTRPSRHFHIDDVDSAKSPASASEAPEIPPASHPFLNSGVGPSFMDIDTNATSSQAPSVLLISTAPGENFTIPSSSKPVSPADTEAAYTFATSHEYQGSQYWPPAISDTSSILPSSAGLSRTSNPSSPTSTEDRRQHSLPTRLRSKRSDPSMLIPAPVRAVGYAPSAWPTTTSRVLGTGSTDMPLIPNIPHTTPATLSTSRRGPSPLISAAFQANTAGSPSRQAILDLD